MVIIIITIFLPMQCARNMINNWKNFFYKVGGIIPYKYVRNDKAVFSFSQSVLILGQLNESYAVLIKTLFNYFFLYLLYASLVFWVRLCECTRLVKMRLLIMACFVSKHMEA